MEITPDTAASLGSKIAELDLTPEELRLLQGVLAEPSEVDGFGQNPVPDYLRMIQKPVEQRWVDQGSGDALWKSDGTEAGVDAVWSMHGGQT